jgi:uncharacterized OB-fold protein
MAAETKYPFPLPLVDDQNGPFWAAAKQHQLAVQRCDDCGRLRFPPSANCMLCGSEKTTWETLSGQGTIFAYVVIHQAMIPAFKEVVPYNVVRVAVAEDPRVILMGNVVGCKNEELKIGMPVEAIFHDVAANDTLVRWQPAK